MATNTGATNSALLIKFETRTNRVKGLSFHPKRPWILASLHTGAIQLWDYRMGSLVDRFEEHEGPVRGVDFHENQPLFVSGGDDLKVKLWNYRLRRCIFTLMGHLDYVRTVEFHKNQPWIVSSSDDQTLRIWNWQSRSCMSVLTGHNHYVMSASFHPRRSLVVSASLDQTLRLWDLTGLKSQSRQSTFAGNVTQDIFGGNDVMVKYILEGHERGVNYASFHPTLAIVVSGADDRSIRVWRIEETRAYETEQFRGHMSNVSCVKYFKDYIVSNSEDRSIRVWDPKIRTSIHVSRRENDRFWVLAVHPERNLIAAGHDSGMIVFKIERERPAMQVVGNTVYWVNPARQLRSLDFDTKQEQPVVNLSRRQTYPPHTMSFCKEENMAVFHYAQDGGTFELYPLDQLNVVHENVKRGFYTSAVFFQRNKFAVLDKSRQIIIKNTQNNILHVLPAVHNANEIFWAPSGQLLLKGDDKVYLFDPHQKKVTAQATAAKVKYVVWSDGAREGKVALLSKHSISVFTKKGLKSVCSLHENSRVKSACFDEKAVVLYYCTMNHLKYCLPNGDTGTIKTLDAPVYLVRAVDDELSFINREGFFGSMKVDLTECRFKLALLNERWNEVLSIVKTGEIHGQALVCYLQQRGFPEVAMHFVKDPKIRFRLALECGNLDDAQECADRLGDEAAWEKLALAATDYGKVQQVATAYGKAANPHAFQKLGFVNFILGNHEKAKDYADMRDDNNLKYQTALLTSDTDMKIKMLEDAGQYTLAHQIAVRSNKPEKAAALLAKAGTALQEAMKLPIEIDEDEEESEDIVAARARQDMRAQEAVFGMSNELTEAAQSTARLVVPATAPQFTSDWPLYRIEESRVKEMIMKGQIDDIPDEMPAGGGGGGAWGDGGMDEDMDMDDGGAWGEKGDDLDMEDDGMGGGGGWGDSDDDIKVEADDLMKGKGDGDIVFPVNGRGVVGQWVNSKHGCDHIAAGSFQSGMKLLQQQHGVKDFDPLREMFYQCYVAATGSLPLPGLPSRTAYQSSAAANEKTPLRAFSVSQLQERLKMGLKHFTDGKFADAKAAFQATIHLSVFLVLDEKTQKARDDAVKKATMYASACSLQLARTELQASDPKKATEMACYFTHYELDPQHIMLVVKQAMLDTYKKGYFRTSGTFGRRLLEFNPDAKLQAQAKKAMTTGDIKEDGSQVC